MKQKKIFFPTTPKNILSFFAGYRRFPRKFLQYINVGSRQLGNNMMGISLL